MMLGSTYLVFVVPQLLQTYFFQCRNHLSSKVQKSCLKIELFLTKAGGGTHTRTAVQSFGYICHLCGSSQGIKFFIFLNVYHVLVLRTFVLLFKIICMCGGAVWVCLCMCLCVAAYLYVCCVLCNYIYKISFFLWLNNIPFSYLFIHLWTSCLICITHGHADSSL